MRPKPVQVRLLSLAVVAAAILLPPAPAGAQQPFDYFSNSRSVVGLKDYDTGVRIEPDNSFGGIQVKVGADLKPLSAECKKTLLNGWMPITVLRTKEGDVAYDTIVWVSPLPSVKDWRKAYDWPVEGEKYLLWTVVKATNTSSAHAFAELIKYDKRYANNETIPHTSGGVNYALMLRHMLVDERGDELHLLAGVPDWWLAGGREIRAERLATDFGEVSLVVRGTGAGVEVELVKPARTAPKRIVLHLPRSRPLAKPIEGVDVVVREDQKEKWDYAKVVSLFRQEKDPKSPEPRPYEEAVLHELPSRLKAQAEGLADPDRAVFQRQAKVELIHPDKDGRIRYTLDGKAPDAASPAYARPIVLEGTTTVTARCFDTAGKALGSVFQERYTRANVEENLTTGKPATASQTGNGELPEFAVDGMVEVRSAFEPTFWGAAPYPQWWMVDLEKVANLNEVHLYTFWGEGRYYQYTIEGSLDGKTWLILADGSKNARAADENGHKHTFGPMPVRYIRVNMLKNSANMGVHIVEVRAYQTQK